MLQIAFVDNPLNNNGSRLPPVVQREIVSYEEFLDYMSRGSVVSEADRVAVMSQFTEALVHFLSGGKRVQTPLGSFAIHLRRNGGDKAQRTISTDRLAIRITPKGEIVDDLKRNLQVSVVDTPPAQVPLVYSVTNIDNRTSQNEGKPGEILHLTGSRLSFDEEDGNQGVFFADGGANETRSQVYSRVGSVFVDCKIPDLASGDYRLIVRTRPAKTLKSGAYQMPVKVVAR